MRVEWTKECLDRLADIAVTRDLPGQDQLERDVLAINKALTDDPWDLGESRGTLARRMWFSASLMVRYEIIPADELVVVQHVAPLRPT